jgi:hypothetical protein
MLIVLHPTKRERARPVDPRIVVLGDYHARLAGRWIEREYPAVFVVG